MAQKIVFLYLRDEDKMGVGEDFVNENNFKRRWNYEYIPF